MIKRKLVKYQNGDVVFTEGVLLTHHNDEPLEGIFVDQFLDEEDFKKLRANPKDKVIHKKLKDKRGKDFLKWIKQRSNYIKE